MMRRKAKGTAAERELLNMLWVNGWACVRAAGSGSQPHPCPDLLAGNRLRKLAIECKAERGLAKYLADEDINQIVEFASLFGAEPWIGIRFDKIGWYFIAPHDMNKTDKGYSADIHIVKRRGLSFVELIEEKKVLHQRL